MADINRAKSILLNFPEEQRKEFILKFNQLDSDDKRQIAIDRLVEKFEPMVESKTPVLGAQQVLPRSPVGPFGRFRLGFGTPEERKTLLQRQFGEVLGQPNREIVRTPKGLQAVNPRGFDVGDVPEFLPRVPGIAGQVIGTGLGGVAETGTGGLTGGLLTAGGAALGTFAGETITNIIGRVIGAKPDSPITKDISSAIREGEKAGIFTLGFGLAGKLVGGTISKIKSLPGTLEKIGRRIGNVKDRTAEWLHQRIPKVGAKMVFTAEKANPEYANRILMPRLKNGVVTLLQDEPNKAIKLLKDFDLSDDTANLLKNKGYSRIKYSQGKLNNSTAVISENIQNTLSKNLSTAGDKFDEFLTKQPQDKNILVGNFVKNMREVFKKEGYMTSDGSFRDINWKLAPRQIRVLRDIYDELIVPGGRERFISTKTTIPLTDYFRYKGIIDNAVSGTNTDWVLFSSKSGLVDDAVKSIKGLEKYNAQYSRWKQLSDEFLPENKTGEKVLERFNNLTQKQKSDLLRLDKEIKFIDDLRNLHAAREVDDILEKQFSIQRIESLFNQAQSEQKTFAKDLLRNVDELLPKQYRFYDDYMDYLANMDFEDIGIYTSQAGLRRFGVEQAIKQLYKTGIPLGEKFSRFGEAIRPVTEPTTKILGKTFNFGLKAAPVALRQLPKEE